MQARFVDNDDSGLKTRERECGRGERDRRWENGLEKWSRRGEKTKGQKAKNVKRSWSWQSLAVVTLKSHCMRWKPVDRLLP